MQDPVEFAVVGLAVLGSISVAVVVEWLSLWGLMKMMPGPEPAVTPAASSEAEASHPRLAEKASA